MSAKYIKPLMERRQAFAERQAKRDVGIFTGKEPMGTGPENRHGMPKLPVGQRETEGHWPVLDLGDVPDIPRAEWRLAIGGLVNLPYAYTWEEFLALPQTENASDFHCVTGWSMMDSCWAGVRFADLAERVGVQRDARYIFVTAYDIAPGSDTSYTANLSLDEAMQPDVMLVHTWQGRPLPVEHGGPVRMITPQLYAWKGAKWVKHIEFLAEDCPGFWEKRGYSMTAHPWYDDRFQRR